LLSRRRRKPRRAHQAPLWPKARQVSATMGRTDRLNTVTAAAGCQMTDETSAQGHSRRSDRAPMTSGVPLEADSFRVRRHVSKVPATDSCSAANAANRVLIRSTHRRARSPAGRAVLHLGFRAGWVRAAGGGERHEDLQEQLKLPNGGVFLGLNGIVIKSHGGSDAEVFADAINLGYKLVHQELHSEIKQTIASAVRRRGHKRRTLWRGVTTRLGQP
jgi:hypothetical protein